MLIPSIDLKNGKVVQLVQGERLAIEDENLSKWIDRFARFPVVQLIDLDAAMGEGDNDTLVARVCGARACRVGGGIRTLESIGAMLEQGASRAILGTAAAATDAAFVARAAREALPQELERDGEAAHDLAH